MPILAFIMSRLTPIHSFILFGVSFTICSDAGKGGVEQSSNQESRAKSAPSKRKSWSFNRLSLKTAEGKPIQVEVPGEKPIKARPGSTSELGVSLRCVRGRKHEGRFLSLHTLYSILKSHTPYQKMLALELTSAIQHHFPHLALWSINCTS